MSDCAHIRTGPQHCLTHVTAAIMFLFTSNAGPGIRMLHGATPRREQGDEPRPDAGLPLPPLALWACQTPLRYPTRRGHFAHRSSYAAFQSVIRGSSVIHSRRLRRRWQRHALCFQRASGSGSKRDSPAASIGATIAARRLHAAQGRLAFRLTSRSICSRSCCFRQAAKISGSCEFVNLIAHAFGQLVPTQESCRADVL